MLIFSSMFSNFVALYMTAYRSLLVSPTTADADQKTLLPSTLKMASELCSSTSLSTTLTLAGNKAAPTSIAFTESQLFSPKFFKCPERELVEQEPHLLHDSVLVAMTEERDVLSASMAAGPRTLRVQTIALLGT